MIINCIKKTLAGILALSLIAGSVSIQTFADEIEQYVPQWIITTSGNDVLNPSKNVLVSTAKGNYPITDAITVYIDKGESSDFNILLGEGVENCDDEVVLAVSDTKGIKCNLTAGVAGNLSSKLNINGVTPGTYTVTVATKSGEANQKIKVVVLNPITSIKLKHGDEEITGKGVTVAENHLLYLTASSTPSTTTDGIEWSVSNNTKAEISSEGTITAKLAGTVTVTARAVNPLYEMNDYTEEQRAAYGLKQRDFEVTTSVTILKANPITKLEFDYTTDDAVNLNVNDTYNAFSHLKTTIRDEKNSSTDSLVWTSSDESIVKVDETGMIKAQNKSGFATVTVSSDSVEPVKASFVVNVSSPASVLKFTSDRYLLDMNEKNTDYIIVSESPNTATEPLEWTVSNPDGEEIVKIIGESDGDTPNVKKLQLQALKTGVVKVTASTKRTPTIEEPNPKNISATCEIEVVESVDKFVSFKISKMPENVTYNGTIQMQKPEVTDRAGNVLEEDKDYTLTYSDDVVNSGIVTVTVNGITSASQNGKLVCTYQILPANISDNAVTRPVIRDMIYNYGDELKPASDPVVRYGGTQLVFDKDISVTYTNNVNVGTAKATFYGLGNYCGSFVTEYKITPKNIGSAKVVGISSPQVYTGDYIIPEYNLYINNNAVMLEENVDYTVEYIDNLDVGTAKAVFTGIGNYTGTYKATNFFKITKKDVTEDNEVFVEDIPDQGYMGGMPIRPEPIVTYNGKKLTENVDYTLTYTNNKNPGDEAYITFNFNKSLNFTGIIKKYFSIVNRNVENPAKAINAFDSDGNMIGNDAVLYVDVNQIMYVDIAIEQESADCDDCLLVAIQANNTNASAAFIAYSEDGKTAKVAVTGKKEGSFTMQISSLSGEVNKKLNFTILVPATKIELWNGKNKVTEEGVFVPENHQTQFTAKFTPSNTTDKIEWSVDDTTKAEISKDDGILTAKKAGTVIVTAKVIPTENSERGLYVTTTVTVVKANPITEINFPFKDISLKVGSKYDALAVLDKSILDSSQSSTDNIIWTSSNEKIAKVDSVTGNITVQNAKGSAVITATTDSLTPVSASFTVNAYTPVTTMTFSSQSYTLLTGNDIYEIALKENPTTANEKIEWEISDESILKIVDSTYNSESNIQILKVKALKTGDCKITARTVRIPTLKEPEPVQVEATCGVVVVAPVTMSNTTITLSATSFNYTGKEIKPVVTVKYDGKALSEKTDYTVSYFDNKDIGTAKVTVTGVGRYVGSVDKSFEIKLPAVTGFAIKSKTDSSVTFSWNRNANATGYIIEKQNGAKWTQVAKITSNGTVTYTVSKLSVATTHTFRIKAYKTVGNSTYYSDVSKSVQHKTPLGAVSGFKVKSLTSTNVTLQWNKNTSASGYEIEQYKSGKWTNVAKITSNATTSYTVKGLAAGTAGYKFRMRAVRDGAYSDYTSALSVNTNPYGVGGFKCSSKTSTSVTLKWNKGTTASGYQLQQYKDGKWVTIYTGTKATNTSYTVKNLKAGTAGYRFRIRAYKTYGNTKQYGSWSSEVKVNTNPYGVGGFKCSSKSSTSVTLKWNKGTTASGYQLQQYKGGKWVTIYTGTKATNTSFTVKGLKAGTAGYRFRIRAYKTYGNTKQYGSWSGEVKVNTNPYGVGGFKAKSTAKNSITLGWNKGTTASGYQLQQYKGGKWVTVYTGTKATSTSCTIKSLKANTSYKFRIRAYKTYGNTKQYGSWSKELTVRTKR